MRFSKKKKVLDRNGPYINTLQIKKCLCLSVILDFCLPFIIVVCVLQCPPAYVEAWNIHQKLGILLLLILYEADFIFSRPFSWAGRQYCPLSEKIISQKWAAFAFGSTYLHQTFIEYMSNQYTYFHISTCQMWLHVMECPFILLRFLGFFIHYYWPFMSELLYFHLIVCLINTHILIYRNARYHSKLWFYSIFFANFAHNWRIFLSEVL